LGAAVYVARRKRAMEENLQEPVLA